MAFSVFQAAVADDQGNVLADAQITVRDEVTGSLASLFQDRDGTTGLTNPFQADADGFFRFYVAAGRYQIDAVKAADSRTWRDVELPIYNVGFLNGWAANSRPAELNAGARWLDISGDSASPPEPWILKIYDGTDDLPLFEINKQTNEVFPYVGQTPLTVILPPDYISGLLITDSSGAPATTIDVSAGFAQADDNSGGITLPAGFSKVLAGPFVEGGGNNGLDTGSVANNQTYDVHAIGKPNGVGDILFTVQGAAPSLPSGFERKRLIGKRRTDASGNLLPGYIGQATPWGFFLETGILKIPNGSNAFVLVDNLDRPYSRMAIELWDISLNSNSQQHIVQLGAASFLTAGYVGATGAIRNGGTGVTAQHTTGFGLTDTTIAAATTVLNSQSQFYRSRFDDVWFFDVGGNPGTNVFAGAGRLDVAAQLQRVQWTTRGGSAVTDTPDCPIRLRAWQEL